MYVKEQAGEHFWADIPGILTIIIDFHMHTACSLLGKTQSPSPLHIPLYSQAKPTDYLAGGSNPIDYWPLSLSLIHAPKEEASIVASSASREERGPELYGSGVEGARASESGAGGKAGRISTFAHMLLPPPPSASLIDREKGKSRRRKTTY